LIKSGDKENIEGSIRFIQNDSYHIIVSSDEGKNLRVLSIEIENL